MPQTHKKKKKILYLITKSNWGGAQRYVFDLTTRLDPAHFDVAVALGGNGELVRRLEERGVRIIPLQNLERDISLIKEYKTTGELWRILKNEQPDILHINSSKAGGLGSLLGRLAGIPHIIFTAHGWAFNEDRPLWQKVIIKLLHWVTILLAHQTIVVSETTKKQMTLPLIQKKMQVIHNGRSINHFFERETVRTQFSNKIPMLSGHTDDFWSVTIGELHPIKQHDVVINALSKVIQKSPRVRHIIIGEGEEREKLQSLIEKLDLTRHVFLVGNIPEGGEYLKGFDLFILGSRSEALAYVVIEACIAGLPIIASDVGGIPEIIAHGKNGFLAASGDSAKIAEYYEAFVSDPQLRLDLARAALLRSQDFTFEKSFAKTLELYEAKGSRAS